MLQLDDKFRVSTDSSLQNYLLEKLEDVKDKKSKQVVRQEWTLKGYHGNNFKSVLRQYAAESLLDGETPTIEHVLEKLEEINQTIDRVVKREHIKLEVKQDD